jgi:hypothetical protein
MLAETRATATTATGQAIVDLTERGNQNGNDMIIKNSQIVDDHMNELCPSNVKAAAKKEARKCVGSEIGHLTSITKRHGINTDRDQPLDTSVNLTADLDNATSMPPGVDNKQQS